MQVVDNNGNIFGNGLEVNGPDGKPKTIGGVVITPSALTKVDDTNVTLTLGGTPSTALLQSVSLTLGWTGTLADSRIASATDWNSAYTNRITSLTTTGSSGASTLIANTLNIPNYTLAGLGGVPTSRNITINGTTQDLSADRTWSVGTVTSVDLLTGTTGTDVGVSGSPITSSGSITLNIPVASATNTGKLSNTDWSTFNSKQDTLVSGVNIKTINGNSVLGSGDLVVSGGGSSAASNLFNYYNFI